MLHGFGQTGRCLGPLARALAHHNQVLCPDLPGHGDRSELASLDCPGIAELLADELGAGVWFGYSMGARIALHVALQRPESVDALVLVGGTAGIDDTAARRARRDTDEARARRLEQLGVAAFMSEWLSMEMFAGLPAAARFEQERTRNTVEGLAGSLRNAGTGSMDPLWGRLGELHMPVLVVSGAADSAYGELAERLVGSIGPNATAVRIPRAGHAAHLERPEAVLTALGGVPGIGSGYGETDHDREGVDQLHHPGGGEDLQQGGSPGPGEHRQNGTPPHDHGHETQGDHG